VDLISQLFVNSFFFGSIYALGAVGFSLLYSNLKFFDFSLGSYYIIGAYITYSLSKFYLPFSLFTPFLVGALGMLVNSYIYQPLIKQNSSNLVLLLASFGVSMILQSIIHIFFGSELITLKGSYEIDYRIRIGNTFLTSTQIYILCIALSFSISMHLFLKFTKFGKAIRAVSDSSEIAWVSGINPLKISKSVYFFSSALVGLAGCLSVLEINTEPSIGSLIILKFITASIVGGLDKSGGAIFGGFLIGFIENLCLYSMDSGWQDFIVFLILILFISFRPSGILGNYPYMK
jgi:branched-chain amino acid transport system permease protein